MPRGERGKDGLQNKAAAEVEGQSGIVPDGLKERAGKGRSVAVRHYYAVWIGVRASGRWRGRGGARVDLLLRGGKQRVHGCIERVQAIREPIRVVTPARWVVGVGTAPLFCPGAAGAVVHASASHAIVERRAPASTLHVNKKRRGVDR